MDVLKKFFENTQPGLITVNEWIMMPDGEEYKCFWCAEWMIITDAMIPLDKFRSSEKWSLAALVNNDIKLLIPGCGVKAFSKCDIPPSIHRICRLIKKEKT